MCGNNMRVYRIISAREITNMYKGLEERTAVVCGENTHRYEKGKSYIHFFRYYESAEYYFKRYRVSMNSIDEYVLYMTANIPNDILRNRLGYGFYELDQEPFDAFDIPIPEYALKQEEMKPEYIVEINNFVKHEYKNLNGEYQKYLELMKVLAEQYHYDFHQVAKYLEACSLPELLGVEEDNRTEDEIFHDKIKQISKEFSPFDYFDKVYNEV